MTDAERQDMTCATCVWRRPLPATERSVTGWSREDANECRRWPPDASHGDRSSVFPIVLDSEWCGEWRK